MFPTAPRQAVAKHVLPSLQKFKNVRPRTNHRPRLAQNNKREMAREFETIFHDLGVIAYSGPNPYQISKVASLLDMIRMLGGPSRIAAILLFQADRVDLYQSILYKRVWFREAECDVSIQPSDDAAQDAPARDGETGDGNGLQTPRQGDRTFRPYSAALMQRHNQSARDCVLHHVKGLPEWATSRQDLELYETGRGHDFPGLPRDIAHTTVEGTRVSCCEYLYTLTIERGKFVVTGHWFGNADWRYLGTTFTSYVLFKQGPDKDDKLQVAIKKRARPELERTNESRGSDPSATHMKSGVHHVHRSDKMRPTDMYFEARRILKMLWELEDQTWAKKALLERKAEERSQKEEKQARAPDEVERTAELTRPELPTDGPATAELQPPESETESSPAEAGPSETPSTAPSEPEQGQTVKD